VPVNQPNNEWLLSTEVGEGRAQTEEENILQSHMCPTQSGKRISEGLRGVRQPASSPLLPPCIQSKSRMRERARTDLVQRITLLFLWVKVPSAEIVQLLP